MLAIERSDDGGTRVLTLGGEIDMESAPRLLVAVQDALRGTAALALDLAGVRYTDSSGIAVLIQGLKLARKRSVEYLLRNPSPQVLSVIQLSHLEDFFAYDPAAPNGGAA